MDLSLFFAVLFFAIPARRNRRWFPLILFGIFVATVVNLPMAFRFSPGEKQPIPEYWFELLSHPAVAIVGSTVAIFLILWGVVRLVSNRDPNRALAHRLEKRGDPAAAAHLFLEGGNPARALRLFQRAHDWAAAAEAAQKLGRTREAAEMLQKAGGRHLSEAARLFFRVGDSDGAVNCTHDFANFLATENRFDEAVEVWLKIGDVGRAVRTAHLALDRRCLRATRQSYQAALRAAREGRDHRLMARLHELGEKWEAAGNAWQNAGDHKRSAAAFAKAGLLDKAASAELAAGNSASAARLRLVNLRALRDRRRISEGEGPAGLPEAQRLTKVITSATDSLIPLLEKLGMENEIIEVLNLSGRTEDAVARLIDDGHEGAAAELAREAQRWNVAAPILERLERWGEASDIYELDGNLAKAAICAERGGEDQRALSLWRALGQTVQAAHCMARIGSLQEALQDLHRQGLLEEACTLLRSFPGPVPDIPDVILDMAAFKRDNGHLEEAVASLQRAVIGVALQPGRLDPAVALAKQLFELGDFKAAEIQLERVLAFDYAHDPALALKAQFQGEPANVDTVATSPAEKEEGSASLIGASKAIQRYEIRHELGRGGMGVVYLARDTRLDRDVAIKVLRTTSDQEASRLKEEAMAVANLNHPGIVTIFDFEAGFDGYFIAMEFVSGETLDSIVKTDHPRIQVQLRSIFLRIATSLAYAHDHHVIHRDLKPANILLTSTGDVKILDFGIAARLDKEGGVKVSVCGTPFYMAPEQIRGEPPTPASDIYSLGATAFHLGTGKPPFPSGNVIEAHLETPPPDPRELNPHIDQNIAQIILRCLAKNPVDRFHNCHELVNTLNS
ncbi:MAG: protein kinase [Thermoanaerobaculales bacterium]|nr:protein kinase [Thermoanaerobaculales bacterium]